MTMTASHFIKRQRGFNLVELMVALMLGLFITAAMISIFVSGNSNYKQDDRFSRMQENGRYALNVLADELGMAGFWGGEKKASAIVSALSTSCGVPLTATDTGPSP